MELIKVKIKEYSEKYKIFGFAVLIVVGIMWIVSALYAVIKGAIAKTLNNQAKQLRDDAIDRHSRKREELDSHLEALGNVKIETIKALEQFALIMESIKVEATGLAAKILKVKIPECDTEELKKMSISLELIIAEGSGLGVGAIIGVAVFGLNIFAAIPMALLGSAAVCVKANSLSKQASRNKKEARKLSKEVDEILEYYESLQEAADAMKTAFDNLLYVYYIQIEKMKRLVQREQKWNNYTKAEKLLVKNTVELTKLLDTMCKIDIIKKSSKEEQIEKVDTATVKEICSSSQSLLNELGYAM